MFSRAVLSSVSSPASAAHVSAAGSEMDASSSCSREYDEEMALKRLFDVFGSSLSLKDIASAYIEGGRNADMASEILYGLRECDLEVVNNGPAGACSSSNTKSEGQVFENNSEKTTALNKNRKISKTKKNSFSIGTVSSVLGRGYVKPASGVNGFCKTSKLLQKDKSRDMIVPDSAQRNHPISDNLRSDAIVPDSSQSNQAINNNDIEQFLFQMLGDGFQLNMDVIREVFGACGYDARKSMDKLLERTKDIHGAINGNLSDVHVHSNASTISQKSILTEDFARRNSADSPCVEEDKYNLSKEVLETLFTVPERSEGVPKRILSARATKRKRSIGKLVTAPFDDDVRPLPVMLEQHEDTNGVPEDDNYLVLRRVAKENWDAMRVYYGAALEAFLKGDRDRAKYLLEEGKTYNKNAREADENSAREIVKPRNMDVQNVVATLDLHEHESKGALRLLKFHLETLANIPTIHFLKLILETETEDNTKGARKRLVKKLLEKENIKWIEEEGNSGIISIRVDEIDPGKLSFAKKLQA